EHQQGIVFMHTVKRGPANQSYGLQVAQLAGIPFEVIEQARKKLRELEQLAVSIPSTPVSKAQSRSTVPNPGLQQAPAQSDLFASAPHPVLEQLRQTELDDLTPRQAQQLLYELKRSL
ncbi:MAG: DNA mismatch repair protein MutS, partial [Pseudohongiella sp.]|nr:DNA mismatch repair protein MutS [Pseudohongiella sp.]